LYNLCIITSAPASQNGRCGCMPKMQAAGADEFFGAAKANGLKPKPHRHFKFLPKRMPCANRNHLDAFLSGATGFARTSTMHIICSKP
jgi:hypothetical protein